MGNTGGGRFSEIYAQARAGRPSLLDIANATGMTRQQREARALREEQLARQDEKDRLALEDQNFDRTMRLTEAKDAREQYQSKRAAAKSAAEEKQNANKLRYASEWSKRDPQGASQWLKDQGLDSGAASVSIAGEEPVDAYPVNQSTPAVTPDRIAAGLEGRAVGTLGPADPEKQRGTGALEEKLRQEGLSPGSPEWHARARQLNNPRSGISINLGDKPLPPSTVESMADSTAAVNAIDSLTSSFNRNVSSEDLVDQVGARVAARIANTDTNIYQSEADITTQTVGSYLEGGVLKEADFARYKAMMPQPGDSAEAAARKAENLKTAIRLRAEERSRQLGGAGYRVPDKPPQADPKRQAALARANEIGRAYLAQNPNATPEEVRAAVRAQLSAQPGVQ